MRKGAASGAQRQKGRERNPNVLDVPWPSNAGVSPASTKPIEQAIHRALSDKAFLKKVAQRHNLYGDGHAAERIIKVIESLSFPLPTTKSFRTH